MYFLIFSIFFFSYRKIQLPQSGADLQTRIFILYAHNLRSLLYVGYCFLGQLLVRPKCHPCPCLFRSHHLAHYVHSNVWHQCSVATSFIYQGHRCLDRGKFFLKSKNIWFPFKILKRMFTRAFSILCPDVVKLKIWSIKSQEN